MGVQIRAVLDDVGGGGRRKRWIVNSLRARLGLDCILIGLAFWRALWIMRAWSVGVVQCGRIL